MPGEGYLEPVVTKLEGDLAGLAKTLAEAKALIKGFGNETERQMHDDGARSGKHAGEALMAEYHKALDGGKSEFRDFGHFVEETIKHNQQIVRGLADELRKTGDIDVWKKLRGAEKDLKAIEEFGKDFAKHLSVGIDEGGKSITSTLQGLVSNAVTGAPLIATLVGALVIASPIIGGALGGALLTGVAGAGIAAAVAAQINDPVVHHAFEGWKDEAKDVFTQATAPIADILTGAFNRGAHLFERMEPSMEAAFGRLAPHVDALFQGLQGLVEKAWPGFLDALDAAGIVLDGIAEVAPELGHDFGVMFRAIADGAPGARDAFVGLLRIVGALMEGIGYLIEGLSKTYTILEVIGDLASGNIGQAVAHLKDLKENTHAAADATNHLADSEGLFAGSAKDSSKAVENLLTSLDKLFHVNMDADQATLRQKQSVEDLTAAIAENGKNWDINTEAGRKNQGALLSAIQAAEEKRKADVAAGKDAVQAAQDYDQEVEALLGIARKAGDSKAALDALKGKYEIDIDEVHRYQFITEGTPPDQFYHGLAGGGLAGPGGIIKAAAGLLAPRSPGTLVLAGEGETGGEWMIPRRGISQDRAAQLIAGAAADHGLGMAGDGAYLQVRVPVMLDGRQLAEGAYEGFVNYGQERKNRRGGTGFE